MDDEEPLCGRCPLRQSAEKASRLDLVVLELAAAEKVFRGLPRGFWDLWVFIEAELGQTEPQGPHHPSGRAYPLGPPWWVVGPCSHVWSSPEASSVPYVQKKISKNFRGIWTPFGIDIMQNQKQAKKQQLALGTELIGLSGKMI